MSTDAYIEEVYKNLKGELSPKEFDAFNKLTAENADLALLRLEIEDAWDISGRENIIVKDHETNLLLRNIKGDKKSTTIFSLRNIITGIAATLILALGSIWLIRDQTDVYTSAGMYTLNDKSTVELREGSRLEVISYDNQVRKVKIVGEAFFNVEKDEKRPFVVNTSNSKITVLGTSFLVKENEQSVFVDLKEGKVEFSALNTSESLVLTKGMQAEYNKDGGLKRVNYQNLSAWRSGTFQYLDKSLAEITEELSLIFNTNIKVDNQELLNCRLSAIFNSNNVEEILKQLAGQLKLDADNNGKDWILSGEKCN